MIRLVVQIEKAEVLKAIADGIIARPDVTGVIDAATVFNSVYEQGNFMASISERVTDVVDESIAHLNDREAPHDFRGFKGPDFESFSDVIEGCIKTEISVAIDKVLRGDYKILLWGQSLEDVKSADVKSADVKSADVKSADGSQWYLVVAELTEYFEEACENLEAPGAIRDKDQDFDFLNASMWDMITAASKLIPNDMKHDSEHLLDEAAASLDLKDSQSRVVQILRRRIGMYCDKDNLNQ